MTPLNNDVRVDRCPLCDSPAIGAVGAIDYGPQVKFSTAAVELQQAAELWSCRACLSRFTQNVLAPDTAADLYRGEDSGSRWSSAPFVERHTSEVVDVLRAAVRPGTKVLDAGANTGALLDFARDLGATTAGAEPSAGSRTTLAALGHAAFASIAEAGDGYDVITAFDLLEHLHDVRGFIGQCLERLRPGGRLLLLTGDCQSRSARLAGASWWYCRYPEHIRFPSRSFFASLDGFERAVPTWASRHYRQGTIRALRSLLGSLVRPPYAGLPPLGPDHQLVIVRKGAA